MILFAPISVHHPKILRHQTFLCILLLQMMAEQLQMFTSDFPIFRFYFLKRQFCFELNGIKDEHLPVPVCGPETLLFSVLFHGFS